jgi:hypothetical protein
MQHRSSDRIRALEDRFILGNYRKELAKFFKHFAQPFEVGGKLHCSLHASTSVFYWGQDSPVGTNLQQEFEATPD